MRRTSTTHRIVTRALIALATAASLLITTDPGIARAELPALADETWGVVGVYESLTTSSPAEVMAIEQIGNTIYVGGQFLEVVRRRVDPHHEQRFLAAFDATSGEFIEWWRPQLDGPVFALEASPDGSRLYVGGEFTSVNGIGDTQGLAVLDPATGEVRREFTAQIGGAPNSSTPGSVRAIRAVSDWVYIGGSFNYVTGPDRSSRLPVQRAARLSAADGTPDPGWRPDVRNGGIWGIDVDEARGRVYLAGFFQSVGGLPETEAFVPVTVADGTAITGLARFPILTPQQAHQFEVLVDGDNVWVVGTQHLVQKLNAADLSLERRWFTGFAPGYHIGGDYQAVAVLGDRIYATCHCWGVIRELPPHVTTLDEARTVTPLAGEIRGIMAFDRTTGDWIPTWTPDIMGSIGGFALHGAGDGCLWAGGDFNRRSVGDTWRNGVVRFCDEFGQGPPVAPPLTEPPDTSESNPPSRPGGAAVAYRPGNTVDLSWLPATDDTAVATYVLYRDGVETARTRRTAIQLPAGGTYSVVAVDVYGNRSGFSDPIVTSSSEPHLAGHWPLDGGAGDMTGYGNDGVISGAEHVPGRIVDALRLEAGDSILVPANAAIDAGAGNGDFAVSAWVRLESPPTGSGRAVVTVDGIASLRTAATTNHVVARVETSAGPATVRSASQLEIDEWTHTSLVRRGGVAELYLNGTLAGTASLPGTTTSGSGAVALAGATASLDDVMVHTDALPAAAVADLATPAFPEAMWAYYPFDGDAADHSGNGFDGTVSGATATAAVHGSGYAFDGADDRITIADDPALRPGAGHADFTVAYWMNLQQSFTGRSRTITHKGNNNQERTFAMWMRGGDDRIRYRLSSDRSWSVGGNSSSWIQVGEWTHVAFVKRGNRVTLYLDGVPDASTAIAGNVIANDGDIHIGDTDWMAATAMLLDDYRIYEYGMRDAEVAALAGVARPPADPPPPLPPAVAIVIPTEGAVTGTVPIRVDATSAVDGPGTLDVDVMVDGVWQQTAWNAGRGLYELKWDTTALPPGPTTLRARATDSNGSRAGTPPVEMTIKAHYPSLVLTDGAVAYWRLDDGGKGAYDSTGGKHRAVYRGPAKRTAPLIEEGGRSATFDGTDDIIAVRDHRDLNTAASYPARTIELWFRPDRTGRRQVLWEEGGGAHGLSIYLHDGRIHAGAWRRSGAAAWAHDVFVSTPFTAGETYHVVLTVVAEGRVKLFVNGARVAAAAGVGAIGTHADNIGIGARNGATRFADKALSGGRGNFFDGVIDEVAVYNVSLTRAQITAHYAAARD